MRNKLEHEQNGCRGLARAMRAGQSAECDAIVGEMEKKTGFARSRSKT